jgi:ORF6N domain
MGGTMNEINLPKIERMIFVIRGQKVMLDSDLAELYEVETKVLNQAVKRNAERFPEDFMFQLTMKEYEFLKSQIVTSKSGRGGKQKLPNVFTENGLAMLSGVLNSPRAIQVHIAIMRIFTRLRSFLAIETSSGDKVDELGQGTYRLFRIVFERLDNLEDIVLPQVDTERRRIGLKINEKT